MILRALTKRRRPVVLFWILTAIFWCFLVAFVLPIALNFWRRLP